ncbi:hypothetical protein D9M70_596140 [compost metagenome]
MPSAKFAPECAALPSISMLKKTPPLRPVTTLPDGRPGSALNTKPACLPKCVIASLLSGDPISSSQVNRPVISGAASPKRAKAASRKAFITMPDFMSATPGP